MCGARRKGIPRLVEGHEFGTAASAAGEGAY